MNSENADQEVKKLLKFWNNLRETFVIGGLLISLKGAVRCVS